MMKIVGIFYLTIVFILSSCGKSSNKTSVKTFSAQQKEAFADIKNQHRCASGSRLADIKMSSRYFRFLPCTRNRQGECINVDTASVHNTLQSGFINGNTTAIYVGLNSYNHLLFVGRVGNHPSVQGFNIILSLCPTRQVSRARIPKQIQILSSTRMILHQNKNCGYDNVTSATLVGHLPPLSSQGQRSPAAFNDFRVVFSSLNCSN